MEAPINNHVRPIVIEKALAPKQDKVPKEFAGDEKERAEIDSKYLQPKWCSSGLNKTQRRKLQHAWHRQQKREKLAKMEGEVVNFEQVKNPPEDWRAAAAAANPAKPAYPTAEMAKLASEVAKMASYTAAALEAPESAKPTLELAE
jgi:hypothetical protein